MIKIWICKYVSKTIITGWYERQWRESISQWRTSSDSLEQVIYHDDDDDDGHDDDDDDDDNISLGRLM